MSGPVAMRDAGSGIEALRRCGVNVRTLETAFIRAVEEADGARMRYVVRGVPMIRVRTGDIWIGRATFDDLVEAVELASHAFLAGLRRWQTVVDALSEAAAWCPVLGSDETVSEAMARLCDLTGEVDALLADIERRGA